MRELNPAQRVAARAPIGQPLKIVAGAGTGKTETLAQRFVTLVERGLAPGQILMLTFTEKAAAEMRGRVTTRLLEAHPDLPVHQLLHPWIHTFHGFCARVLADHTLWLGLATPPSVLEEWQQRELWESIWQDFEQTMELLPNWRPYSAPAARAYDWHSRQLAGRVVGIVEQLRALGLSSAALRQLRAARAHQARYQVAYRQLLPVVGHCYDAYQQQLQAHGQLDFAELILAALRLMEEHPEPARRMRERFGAILVDEFQDTDRAQLRLLELLDPGFARTAVVGDPRQALYGWRQARVENIIAFPPSGGPALTVALRDNYRSALPICELANLAIAGYELGDQPEFDPAEGLVAAREVEPQRVALRLSGGPEEEATFVAERAAELHQQGARLGSMALLLRSRTHLRLFEDALLRRRVPYEVVGGLGFYDQREVRDTLALLRLLDAPDDALALIRLLQSGLIGLPDGALVVVRRRLKTPHGRPAPLPAPDEADWLERWAELLPPAWALREQVLAQLGRFAELYAELRRLAAASEPARLLETFWRRSGLRERLLTTGTPESMRQLLSLEKLSRLAYDYQRRSGLGSLAGLSSYLARLSAGDEAVPALQETLDALQIMTVHAAKGREFDTVFLADTRLPRHRATSVSQTFFDERQGLVISDDKAEDPEVVQLRADQARRSLNEERCIWYVALTRARRQLYVLHDSSRCLVDGVADNLRFARPARNVRGEHFFHQLWNQLRTISAPWRDAVALVDGRVALPHSPALGTIPPLEASDAPVVAVLAYAAPEPAAPAAPARSTTCLSEHAAQPALVAVAGAMAARIAALREAAMAPLVRLSFSAWDSYQLCPHQYRVRFLLGWERMAAQLDDFDMTVQEHTHALPELPGVWPQALGVGLHRALAYAGRQPQLPALDAALDVFHDEVRRLVGDSAPYAREAERVLGRALADPALWAARPSPADLERHFTLTASSGALKVQLRGVIDRLDRLDGRWRIIDYKWAAELDLERVRRQLGLYRLAWQELMPGQPEPALYVYDLRHARLIPLEAPPPGELAEALGMMAAELAAEHASFARQPGDWCGRCPVRRLDPRCGM